MNANIFLLKKSNSLFDCTRKLTRDTTQLSFRQVYLIVGVFIAALVVTYVYLVNLNATKGYTIRSLENDKKAATFQVNLLQIKIAEAQSISRINAHPHITKMKDVSDPIYLTSSSPTLTYDRPTPDLVQ